MDGRTLSKLCLKRYIENKIEYTESVLVTGPGLLILVELIQIIFPHKRKNF